MDLNNISLRINDICNEHPHGSNLHTKINNELKKSSGKAETLISIGKSYLTLLNTVSTIKNTTTSEWVETCLLHFENYYNFLRLPENNRFSHQSDFLSSLVPEFLFLLYSKFITTRFPDLQVRTQRDIIIDMSFLSHQDSPGVLKSKRVDVAIVKPTPLLINEERIDDFNITIVGIEVKTNLDKNMISGVEYSVDRLKKTFPLSKFYLISEFADFAFEKQNYASSQIDEIIILRKQKRSEVRGKPERTKSINADLVTAHIEEILTYLNEVINAPKKLNERMQSGKLIR